jgi:hypothetical protein
VGRDWLGEEDADDWMEPEERYVGVIEAEFNARKAEAQALIADAKALPSRLPALTVPDIPTDPEQLVDMFEKQLHLLDQRQRIFLALLRQNHFNIRKTTRLLEGTPDAVSRLTVRNWEAIPAYALALKIATSLSTTAIVKKERLLLRADEIAEEALEPKAILHKGLPTGFYENQPDVALRANEQLMKTQKMLGNDDAPVGGIVGPALVIQVVQRDGAIIDVKPRGVTIDLPPPDAA